MISQSLRDRILDSLDVRAILGELGISYQEHGYGNLWACCPLPEHNEKSASFRIHSRFGHWHCFGCGRRGGELDGGIVTLIAVLLDMRKCFAVDDAGDACLDRDQAWEWLAERAGVTVDPVQQIREGSVSPRLWEPKVKPVVQTKRLDIPESLPAYESREARAYLESRGITEAEMWRYQIRWWAKRRRVIIPTYTEGDLVNWDARTIDVHCPKCSRDFPVVDGKQCPRCGSKMDACRPKTFGARKEDGARPDWSIGCYDLVPRMAHHVVVTEGPFDAWHVMRNLNVSCVYVRGSRMHERQMRLLARWPRVTIMPDADDAGRKLGRQAATMAALVQDDRVALREVRVAHLPHGCQPEDVSASDLQAVIDSADHPMQVQRRIVIPTPLVSKI